MTSIFSSLWYRVKGFYKKNTVQRVMEKIPENLDFAENSNIIRKSTQAAICWCSGFNSQENTCGRVVLQGSPTGGFL